MALAKIYHAVQDKAGNTVPSVQCTVTLHGSSTLAPLFSDSGGLAPLPNPLTSDVTYGSLGFYVASGHYDLSFAKPGYTFQPLLDYPVSAETASLGTMASQNANAVAITGGTIGAATAINVTADLTANTFVTPNRSGSSVVAYAGQLAAAGGTSRYNLYMTGDAPNYLLGHVGIGLLPSTHMLDVLGTVHALTHQVDDRTGSNVTAFGSSLVAAGGTNRFNLYVNGDAPNYLAGNLGLGRQPSTTERLSIDYPKATMYGISVRNTDADTGGGGPMAFLNQASAVVGSITTTATATTYGTSSDARLKANLAPLTGGLDTCLRLHPCTWIWTADGSPGEGLVAADVQALVPLAVHGTPDAVDDAGAIIPQQLDYAKLVVWLLAGLQELAAQMNGRVPALMQAVVEVQERVAVLEGRQ